MSVVTGNLYDKYGTSNPVYRRLMANFHRNLFALLQQANPASILEVGCGEGHWLGEIRQLRANTQLTGLDIGWDVLREAQQAVPAANLLMGDIHRLPFPTASFELLLAAEVLEHVPDPSAAVTEMARVTRQYCLISVPHEPFWRLLNMARLHYLDDFGNTPGHIQHFSPASLRRLVSKHFEVLAFRRVFPWLMLLGQKHG